MKDLHQMVTNQVIEMMETAGTTVRLPWHLGTNTFRLPTNAVTQKPYRGINVVILWSQAERQGYRGHQWATYKQWSTAGCQVRKGERSQEVVLYRKIEEASEEPDAEPKAFYFLRHFRVFNADQVDGWQQDTPLETTITPMASVQAVIGSSGARIDEAGARAYYRMDQDRIRMPDQWRFNNSESWYAVLMHELTHWTGHGSRCDRDLSGRFGSAAYAMEELIAELGAAFLCAEFGISQTPRKDHACYLNNWLEVLKCDKKAIFHAASQATKAVEYLQPKPQMERVAA